MDVSLEIIETIVPYLREKSFLTVGLEKRTFTYFFNTHGFINFSLEVLPKHLVELPDNERIAIIQQKFDSLLQKRHISEALSVVKINIDEYPLHVLKGMACLKPEMVICEFLIPDIYEMGEKNYPHNLMTEARTLGFQYCIIVKRFDRYELVSINNPIFINNQWGTFIFIRDDIYNAVKFALEKIIFKKESIFFYSFSDNIRSLRERCQELRGDIVVLQNTCNDIIKENKLLQQAYNERAEVVEKINDTLNFVCNKTFAKDLTGVSIRKDKIIENKTKKEKIKKFFKPRIGVLSQYDSPRSIDIPKYYTTPIFLKKFPLISLVTPSFNQGRFLEKTITSIVEQRYPSLEYIIQDGGSQDESINIIQRYEVFLKYWESNKDLGQSNAINLGFQHTTGDIMAYLNADDIFLPGTLYYVARYFCKHPEVDVVYGHRILIDEEDQEIGRWVLPRHDDNGMLWVDYIPQETLFWRRRIWEKVGGSIDESFKFAMDWDLILRFKYAKAKFVRLPRFLGAFRVHPNQKTSSILSEIGEEETNYLRMRYHGSFISKKEIHKKIKWYLIKHFIYHKLYRAGILRY